MRRGTARRSPNGSRRKPRRGSLPELGGALEQPVLPVQRRIADDLAQEPVERSADRRPLAEPRSDQVGAVDCQVTEPVRILQLALDDLAEPPERRELVLGQTVRALSAQVGFLVVDEVEGQLLAVPGEEPAG